MPKSRMTSRVPNMVASLLRQNNKGRKKRDLRTRTETSFQISYNRYSLTYLRRRNPEWCVRGPLNATQFRLGHATLWAGFIFTTSSSRTVWTTTSIRTPWPCSTSPAMPSLTYSAVRNSSSTWRSREWWWPSSWTTSALCWPSSPNGWAKRSASSTCGSGGSFSKGLSPAWLTDVGRHFQVVMLHYPMLILPYCSGPLLVFFRRPSLPSCFQNLCFYLMD